MLHQKPAIFDLFRQSFILIITVQLWFLTDATNIFCFPSCLPAEHNHSSGYQVPHIQCLGALAKLRKATTCFFIRVSVCPHGSHTTDSHQTWYLATSQASAAVYLKFSVIWVVSVFWLITDVSGQPICHIFMGQMSKKKATGLKCVFYFSFPLFSSFFLASSIYSLPIFPRIVGFEAWAVFMSNYVPASHSATPHYPIGQTHVL